MGDADGSGRVRISESEQHGHGLRRSEREVVAGHLVRLAERCPGRRVMACEDVVECVGFDDAVEAEQVEAAGDPLAGRFAADVVVLDALGDGFEVVPLLAGRQLPHAQHGRTPRCDARRASPRTMVQIRAVGLGVVVVVRVVVMVGVRWWVGGVGRVVGVRWVGVVVWWSGWVVMSVGSVGGVGAVVVVGVRTSGGRVRR